jgi:hypothetical protein
MIHSVFRTEEPIGRPDVAIAAVLSLLGLALMYDDTLDPAHRASYLAIPVFLLVTVPVLWRRHAPLPALIAVLAGLVVHIGLFGTVTRCGVVFSVTWLLSYGAGARLPRAGALAALIIALGCVVVMASSDGQIPLRSAAFFGPLTAVVWGAGRLARSRGQIAAALRRRTEELREVREERVRLQTATDRARLSGDLETALHRRLARLSRLADAGAVETDVVATTATLAEIERESRQTLEEMRGLVGVLRDTDTTAGSTAPAPTLMSLDALILGAAGSDTHLIVDGRPRALPAGVELSAYRIVEHLLGALDDAPGVEVGVRFGVGALEITVTGPVTRRRELSSSIERARERAQLHQGTLKSTIGGGRADVVASLPLFAGA